MTAKAIAGVIRPAYQLPGGNVLPLSDGRVEQVGIDVLVFATPYPYPHPVIVAVIRHDFKDPPGPNRVNVRAGNSPKINPLMTW